MATRLSYLLWGTTPDDALRARRRAASSRRAGVLGQATRCSTTRVASDARFFFDNLLPINGLTDLERDKTLFPGFTAQIGGYMPETQIFLEYEISTTAGELQHPSRRAEDAEGERQDPEVLGEGEPGPQGRPRRQGAGGGPWDLQDGDDRQERMAVVSVTPSKAGIIRVLISNRKACNTQRIGIVGVYEPPVTG